MSNRQVDGPIMVSGPRPWWHVPVGIVVGLGVIGGVGTGYWYVAHRAPLTRQPMAVGHHKIPKTEHHPPSPANTPQTM